MCCVRGNDTGGRSSLNILFGIDKEEQFVLDDRAANTGSLYFKLKRRFGNHIVVCLITDGILIFKVVIQTTSPFVGAATGDGVNTSSCKSSLPNIIRRHVYLNLFNGIQRDRLCAGLSTQRTRESE